MLKVNAMGDTCPIPVVKTKDTIRRLGADGGVVETLVDNEIAVQNLTKMANQKGYGVESEKLGENEYRVTMTVGAGASLPAENEETVCAVPAGQKNIPAMKSIWTSPKARSSIWKRRRCASVIMSCSTPSRSTTTFPSRRGQIRSLWRASSCCGWACF